MSDINVCLFTGKLTRDPEVKETANGSSFLTFTLAVNDYAGKDNPESTSFLDFTYNRINIAQYMHKGDMLTVQASAKQRKYTDRDGKERSRIGFSCKQIQLPPKPKSQQYNDYAQEDIPF